MQPLKVCSTAGRAQFFTPHSRGLSRNSRTLANPLFMTAAANTDMGVAKFMEEAGIKFVKQDTPRLRFAPSPTGMHLFIILYYFTSSVIVK